MRFPRPAAALPILLAALAGLTACGSSSPSSAAAVADHAPQQLTLYTSVTQNTVTAVVNGFAQADPGVKVRCSGRPPASSTPASPPTSIPAACAPG